MGEERRLEYPLIIIGSGPAGLTAAIYAARANLEPLVIEGAMPGGQLTTTTEVENYPGFEKGVLGPDLMEVVRKQAARFGTDFLLDDVAEVDFSGRPFQIRSGAETYRARALIVASGASPRRLGLPSEDKYWNNGVHTCATCDGYFYRGKPVAIVGGGDSAIEEAGFLARVCESVKIIHRREELRASKIMQKRAMDNPKIDFAWNSVVEEIVGEEEKQVTGIRLKNVKTGKTESLRTDALFLAIGHIPNTGFLKGKIDLDHQGYIVTLPGSSKTSVEGVFAAGDVHDHTYRQAVTAAGFGCMAALDAERYLG